MKPDATRHSLNVVILYHDADAHFLRMLESHVDPLRRKGIIDIWHRGKLLPGETKDAVTIARLRVAHLVLFLASADFNSTWDSSWDERLADALRHSMPYVQQLIPVHLRPSSWSGLPFYGLQPLPKDGQPLVVDGKPVETRFCALSNELRDLVLERGRPEHQIGDAPPTELPFEEEVPLRLLPIASTVADALFDIERLRPTHGAPPPPVPRYDSAPVPPHYLSPPVISRPSQSFPGPTVPAGRQIAQGMTDVALIPSSKDEGAKVRFAVARPEPSLASTGTPPSRLESSPSTQESVKPTRQSADPDLPDGSHHAVSSRLVLPQLSASQRLVQKQAETLASYQSLLEISSTQFDGLSRHLTAISDENHRLRDQLTSSRAEVELLRREVERLTTIGANNSAPKPAPESPRQSDKERRSTGTAVGDVIDGFQLKNFVRRGGVGTVYTAFCERRAISCAFKIINPAGIKHGDDHQSPAGTCLLSRYDEIIKALQINVKLPFHFNHPNIVRIFDFNDSSPMPWLAMDYLGPDSLEDWLRSEGPAPAKGTCRIIRLLADAIDYIHDSGVAHLDLKLGNIMLQRGDPVIVDFDTLSPLGAKPRFHASNKSTFAPEFFTNSFVVDRTADVYSLAIVSLQLFTGNDPFSVSATDSFGAVAERKRAGLADSSFPASMSEKARLAIRRALSVDPLARQSKASCFAQDLCEAFERE